MIYHVNDTKAELTLLACKSFKEAKIYATWANECMSSDQVQVSSSAYSTHITGDRLLSYFDFTIDSLVERIFLQLPSRSRVESNIVLIKAMLKEPCLSKSVCCREANKYPTHYSRLSKTIGQHCALIASVTGGRNPMKLLRRIRGDL